MKNKLFITSVVINVLLLVALLIYPKHRERQVRLDVQFRTRQAFKQLSTEDLHNQKPERTVGLKEAYTIFLEANPLEYDEKDLLKWLDKNEGK